jgi:hypothetical protein
MLTLVVGGIAGVFMAINILAIVSRLSRGLYILALTDLGCNVAIMGICLLSGSMASIVTGMTASVICSIYLNLKHWLRKDKKHGIRVDRFYRSYNHRRVDLVP